METIEDYQVVDWPRVEVRMTKSNKGADLYDVFAVWTKNDDEPPAGMLLASGLAGRVAAEKIEDVFEKIVDHCVDPKTLF